MPFIGWTLALAVLALLQGGQQPRGADATTVQAGGALFRERCADCHGADAKGGRGPDLTRLWTADGIDEKVFQTIRAGIAGSIMPPTNAPDAEIRAIVAYLRNISTARAELLTGNAANGEKIFSAQCATCHRIDGRGGRLGPDLSRIAASQSNQLLTRAVREASASFTTGYEPVLIVTRDGQQVRGARKAEDVFSIQIMDTKERLQGYLKSNLREVTRERKSLMPDFGSERLSDADLNDLLAFLGTRRVAAPARGRGSEPPVDQR